MDVKQYNHSRALLSVDPTNSDLIRNLSSKRKMRPFYNFFLLSGGRVSLPLPMNAEYVYLCVSNVER